MAENGRLATEGEKVRVEGIKVTPEATGVTTTEPGGVGLKEIVPELVKSKKQTMVVLRYCRYTVYPLPTSDGIVIEPI
jgi:hypothetical protein